METQIAAAFVGFDRAYHVAVTAVVSETPAEVINTARVYARRVLAVARINEGSMAGHAVVFMSYAAAVKPRVVPGVWEAVEQFWARATQDQFLPARNLQWRRRS